MKKTLLFCALFCSSAALAKGSMLPTPLPINTINTHWQATADSIKLPPEGRISAGHSTFIAGSYLIDFAKYFYGGITGMASITGGHGGFFILGGNAGIHIPIGKYFFTEAGSFLGSGGGYTQIVGGGLFVQPYVDAGVNLKYLQVAARYSHMQTPSHGRIKSDQVGLLVNIPTHLYAEGQPVFNDKNFNFLPVYVAAGYMNYISKTLSLANIQQIGFELGYYFTPHFFGTLSPAAAFRTGTPQNGYMEIFAGLGYNLPLSERFSVVAQVAGGAAGGGSTATKDGAMLRTLVGLQGKLTRTYSIELNGGYLKALNTNAKGGVINARMLYYFGYPRATDGPGYDGDWHSIEWQARLFNQSYLKPKHTREPSPSNVQLSSIQFDLGLSDHWYATAQTNVAYHGMSGGYAAVYLGAGVRTQPFTQPGFSFGGEMLVGAAGAGYMAVGDSLLLAPTADVYYNFNEVIGVYVGGGQLFTTKKHNMSTPIINAGLTFHIRTVSD